MIAVLHRSLAIARLNAITDVSVVRQHGVVMDARATFSLEQIIRIPQLDNAMATFVIAAVKTGMGLCRLGKSSSDINRITVRKMAP